MSNDNTAFQKWLKTESDSRFIAVSFVVVIVAIALVMILAVIDARYFDCDTSCKLDQFNEAVTECVAQGIYTADECKDIVLTIGGE